MVDSKEREIIRKIALLNALNYGGKAQFQPVLGKLLTEQPQLKSKIKEMLPIINEIIKEVNALSLGKQKKIVEENGLRLFSKKRWKKRGFCHGCRMWKSMSVSSPVLPLTRTA
jgi:glutamyl-tRNA synthetase